MRLECYAARVYNAIDVIVNHTQKKNCSQIMVFKSKALFFILNIQSPRLIQLQYTSELDSFKQEFANSLKIFRSLSTK